MKALDTNILARYLLGDDARQAEQAALLLESGGRFFVPVTVALELAWVLRSEGVPKADVLAALRHVQGLPDVEWQFAGEWRQALVWADGGLDVADALHLALSGKCSEMVTFDERFAARAGREKARPGVALAGE
jgi:predicted nucleic acid-binding protein